MTKETDFYNQKTKHMSEATIVIDEAEARKRFQDETNGSMHSHDSYMRWLSEGVSILKKNLNTRQSFSGEKSTIKIQMPESWIIHSAPGMKYTLCELIHNSMMADWNIGRDDDKAKQYRQSAEFNKAQLQAEINSLDT